MTLCVFSSEGRDSDISEGEVHITAETVEKKKSRKRKRDPKSWKCNVRKNAHDEGKEYTYQYEKN